MGNCACLPGNKHKSAALGPIPKVVSELFESLSQGKATLSEKDVRAYLKAHETVSSDSDFHQLIVRCKQAVSTRRTSGASGAGPLEIDLDEFFALLQDTDVNALHEVGKVTHDMSLPLSHYYIYTGHNSYLSGNQLTSDSSAVPIIDALKRGCRVIELDCWPDGEQIKVVHGKTLCKPAPVLDLLHAIKEYAFVASDFPLMLTIENHLPAPLQNLLAQHFKDVFGEQLFTKTSDGPLLSPNDLRRRFLISTKSTKETEEGVKGAKKPPTDLPPVAEGNIPAEEPEDDIKQTVQGPEAASNGNGVAGSEPGSKRPSLAEADAEGVIADVTALTDAAEFDKSLSSLIYIPTLKSKLVGTTVAGERKAIRASFSEPQFDEVAERDPLVLTKFSQHNMVRVYPYGLRFDSSNLDPVKVWCHGGQLAAMNMQGYGRNLWLSHGFFLANGGCGYVRKPDFFYPPSTETPVDGSPAAAVFDPRQSRPVKTTLKIRILWGHDSHKRYDAMSLPDFFVRVAICGVPADTKKSHTKVRHDTNHPIWEDELFEFPLTAPELAILALEMRESDRLQRDDFACQACVPVAEIRMGVRSIAMKDERGNVIPDAQAKLLVHVELS